jgi:tetratricopeptide (TPR) repeat protein
MAATMGADHPDTLTVAEGLAGAYWAAARKPEAIEWFEKIYKSRSTKLGLDHPATVNSLRVLAAAYLTSDKLSQAIELYNLCHNNFAKRFGPKSLELGTALAETGSALLHERAWVDAETYMRACEAIRMAAQPDIWSTFNAKSILGASLLGQKKYDEAEPLLIEGYRGMKDREQQIPPQGRVYLTAALERLVDLYTSWNKSELATQWRHTLEAANIPPDK